MSNEIKIPTSFQLFGQTVKVKIDNSLLIRHDCEGLWSPRENTIFIALLNEEKEELPLEKIEQTLLHEIVHAILDHLNETELSYNEKFVDTFSLCFHQYLKTAKYKKES